MAGGGGGKPQTEERQEIQFEETARLRVKLFYKDKKLSLSIEAAPWKGEDGELEALDAISLLKLALEAQGTRFNFYSRNTGAGSRADRIIIPLSDDFLAAFLVAQAGNGTPDFRECF